MATKKKLLEAAAGSAGGAGLNIEEIFSTYVYDGTGSAQTITNGIDLAGEGGLVWIKNRSQAQSHLLTDTENGANNQLMTDLTAALQAVTNRGVTAFNTDGFDLGSSVAGNRSGDDFASFSFRKAPKFFTCLTYTGDGASSRTISHNLNTTVGTLILKRTDNSSSWSVYHRSTGVSQTLLLEGTSAAFGASGRFGSSAPTSTTFDINSIYNVSGASYVAYLFAHNDGDGEFGPDGDADIIKCGSFTTDGSGVADVNLGFEPAWLLTKASSTTSYWALMDEMRGFGADVGMDYMVQPNTSNAEVGPNYLYKKNATGFSTASLSANQTYIYIAIRRGPMAVPESATDVFAIDTAGGTSPSPPLYNLGKPVDFALTKTINTSSTWNVTDRLRQGKRFRLPNTDAESALSSAQFDYQEGHTIGSTANSNVYSWMWRRAPSYFDVVAYTGEGTKQTISHNLGVAPEMMWIKVRSTTQHWAVYHPDLPGSGKFISLNNNWDGNNTNSNFWDGETPTSTTFSVGATGVNNSYVNGSGNTYIAYLFATLAGVTKVGSYTGNGSNQTIDCGFTAGARFVLIKRTDSTGDWYVWDTERGIVAANDPHLSLNTTAAEVTTDDSIDPVSSGFAVNQVAATNINVSSATYIFYAIA